MHIFKNLNWNSFKQISKDENAKKLAEKYQANFVMTLSTFENLMSQYQNEDELFMPFSVQEFKTGGIIKF